MVHDTRERLIPPDTLTGHQHARVAVTAWPYVCACGPNAETPLPSHRDPSTETVKDPSFSFILCLTKCIALHSSMPLAPTRGGR